MNNNDTTGKKTLHLAIDVDVAKVAEQKQKQSKQRVIETRGTAVKNKVVKENKPEEAITNNNLTETALNNNNLTKEEILNRIKALDSLDDANKSSLVSGVGRIQVVQKETIIKDSIVKEEPKEEPIKEVDTTTTPIIKTSLQKIVRDNSSKVNKSANSAEENLETNKLKKPSLSEAPKKVPVNNWRNLDVSIINSDEEDEDINEEEVLEVEQSYKKPAYVKRKKKSNISKQKQYVNIEIKGEITVLDLSRVLQEKTYVVLKVLSNMGVTANENSELDAATAEIVATELGHSATIIERESVEEIVNNFEDEAINMKPRPPVVAIMGHVDHGKTSLLDAIRKTSVVSGEAGGITQHIGAYQIKTAAGEIITFLDTPGHEAFSAIRSRGSKVTDIILLVVAADDGLKPQTIEAIEHAQKANVPLIVVVNKIDKPDVNVNRIKTDLLQHNVIVEEMGGETLIVEVSATAKIGLDKLLETILLQAEILSLQTSYTGRAKGTVIEVKVQKGLGFLATILLDRGELKLTDNFVCGTKVGKVKMIVNDKGERLKSAPPYLPIEISGFNDTVQAGDSFIVVKNEQQANELANYRLKQLNKKTNIVAKFNLQNLLSTNIDLSKTLSVIVKTDTQGSLEAITSSLENIEHSEIKIKVILGAVGEITESDINFAKISSAIIFGFNSRANTNAKELAKKDKIELRYHSIIYKIIDDAKLIMSGMLDPEIVENIIGYATVKQVFNISKLGNIAGCVVTEGIIKKTAFVRLLRNNIVLYNDVLSQLKHFKDDVKEAKSGSECGIAFANYTDIIAGDTIECYEKTSNQKIVK